MSWSEGEGVSSRAQGDRVASAGSAGQLSLVQWWELLRGAGGKIPQRSMRMAEETVGDLRCEERV